MLSGMWVLPALAALVAFAFAARLLVTRGRRPRPFEGLWAAALAMYGIASLAVALGVADGWTEAEFLVYWGVGAVLNVPFLAAGEVLLLFRRPVVGWAVGLVLVFVVAYTVAVLRGATLDAQALMQQLPSGKEVFGDGSAAHRLPQYVSYPSYFALVAGALWSAWRMRGRPELRDRFVGTLLIVVGATVVAGFGSAFAALGRPVAFSLALLVGIAVMFWGFLRATRARAPAAAATVG
jgi:hypothetical protein